MRPIIPALGITGWLLSGKKKLSSLRIRRHTDMVAPVFASNGDIFKQQKATFGMAASFTGMRRPLSPIL
jgi:hypothetical protein